MLVRKEDEIHDFKVRVHAVLALGSLRLPEEKVGIQSAPDLLCNPVV